MLERHGWVVANKLIGLDATIKALNKEINKIEGVTVDGLIEAGFLIKRESLKQTPVDTGNLRGSAYVVSKNSISASGGFTGEGSGEAAQGYAAETQQSKTLAAASEKKEIPLVIVGYSARYAAIVHEALDVVFQRPGAKAKFLEDAIKANVSRIIKIIKNKVSR